MNQKVTGCSDCPLFYNDSDYGYFCNHSSVRDDDNSAMVITTTYVNDYMLVTPDWCPLKKEPITITFEQ